MPDFGELIAVDVLIEEFKKNCPFKEEKKSGPKRKGENIADDDKDEVQELQKNDGGVLGDNVQEGKKGEADGGPFVPTESYLIKQKADDSYRGRQMLLHLEEYKEAEEDDFPFTVAAHHLIPGNASLYKKDVKLIDWMDEGGKVKSKSRKSYTITGHIGYDVNGAHNGVWLPGNYAIKTELPQRKIKGKTYPAREGTGPFEDVSWEELGKTGYEEWQFHYVAGACKAAKGQFHDSHEDPYSESVRQNLLKIVIALAHHLDNCGDCKNKTPAEVPPPFRIKRRLYQLSKKLRTFVQGAPGAWKKPWFTSERWSGKFFKNGKITKEFMKAYREAELTKPKKKRS